MDFEPTLKIPVTIYGMRVKYITPDDEVETKIFPFRKKLSEMRKEFGEPNNLKVIEVKSVKQEFEINWQQFYEKAELVETIVNKNGIIQ